MSFSSIFVTLLSVFLIVLGIGVMVYEVIEGGSFIGIFGIMGGFLGLMLASIIHRTDEVLNKERRKMKEVSK